MEVPYVELTASEVLRTTPPDGVYVVIWSHKPSGPFALFRRRSAVDPWIAEAYSFIGGAWETIMQSTSPGEVITSFDVDCVYLVGLDEEQKAELMKKLKRHSVVLLSA